jgi:uncharacterized OB-fold protein
VTAVERDGPGPIRPSPDLRSVTRPFWTGGKEGELRVQRCVSCERLVHPPALRCPYDSSGVLEWVATAGTGRVESWTWNRHSWFPGFEAPYLIALVTLDDDPRTRLLTNLVDVERDEVSAGMAVEVVFERVRSPDGDGDDAWLPLFRPRTGDDAP